MATSYFNAANVDFDDLFEPDPAGVTIPGFYAADGVTLLRYASVANGSKIPDVIFFHTDGPDVTNYWAGKGTVAYVTPVIPFSTVRADWTYPVNGVTRCSLTLYRNGTWFTSGTAWQQSGNQYPSPPGDNDSGTWYPNAPADIGDQYDAKFVWSLMEDTGGWQKTVSNGATDWTQLSSGLNISTTVQGAPTSNVVRYQITVYIRRRSTGQVVSTSTAQFMHSLVYL